MAKVMGLDFVALQVRDLEASKDFYTNKLGLELAPQSPPNAYVFKTAPIPFAVRVPSVNLDEVTKLGWGVALWMNCDDANGLHDKLVADGVPVVQSPFDGPFGRTFVISDLDGYLVTIHQN